MTTATRDRRSAGTPRHRSLVALTWWLGLLTLALAAWWSAGTPPAGAAGHTGGAGWLVTVSPPAVLLLGWLAVHRRLHERAPWPVLLTAGYVVSAAWTLGLAAISDALADAAGTAGSSVAPALTDRLLAELAGSGVDSASARALVCLVGATATPLVLVATRSLCDELTARRLVLVLAVAPYALAGADVEAIALALGTATLALATTASEHDRPGPYRLVLAAGCGLLLGAAALFGYAAILLAAGVVCVFFVRRRPLLNVAAAATFFVPLLLARSTGRDWTADLATALRPAGDQHAYLASAVAAAVVLLLLGGPALAASLWSMRMTPGWPLLVAGGAVVLVSVVAGLLTGRVAPGSWLPGLPWLLIAAVAPQRQGGRPVPTPSLLVVVGGVSAYAVALITQAG